MDEFRGIRVVATGTKYQTEQGFTAIKNGVKARDDRRAAPSEPKPPWLRARIPSGERFEKLRDTVRAHRLATVCEESICPNIGECWNNGTATLMLMGAVCTRACQFCAVDTGNPRGWLDHDEVENSARTVKLMNLKYVVLTSVDRDDLPDGGAAHYAACVRAIKAACPETAVEALTPDFAGNLEHVEIVVDSGVDVFAQNLETVKRLTSRVRDARAGYAQTLAVLAHAKRHRPGVITKTSLMLGLGETDDEILEALDDLKRAAVDVVTFGQYLRPTPNHLPVERYVTPHEFELYRQWGLASGFLEVVAGPLVRSSYRADRVFEKNNVGLTTE
jgi:lipoic acid synthetase